MDSSLRNLKSNMYLRRFRRKARRLRQIARFHTSLSHLPILFANSFPKSGTHLLIQVLDGMSRIGPAVDSGMPAIVTYQGNTGQERTEEEILGDLQRLLPGDIAYGHLHATPNVTDLLCREQFATYFIIRDPRDVVVSHVHYVTDIEPQHIYHDYYSQILKSLDERLRTSIVGIPGERKFPQEKIETNDIERNFAFPLPNIYQRFEPYTGWLERHEVLLLHFEDFITKRDKTIDRVLTHAMEHGFTPACDKESGIKTLSMGIEPSKSPTFRSGKVGGWREVFTDEHKQLFKDITGDLLIQLGYEQNSDW